MVMFQKFEGSLDHAVLKKLRPSKRRYAAREALRYSEVASLPSDFFAQFKQSRGPATDDSLPGLARRLDMGVNAAREIETPCCRGGDRRRNAYRIHALG